MAVGRGVGIIISIMISIHSIHPRHGTCTERARALALSLSLSLFLSLQSSVSLSVMLYGPLNGGIANVGWAARWGDGNAGAEAGARAGARAGADAGARAGARAGAAAGAAAGLAARGLLTAAGPAAVIPCFLANAVPAPGSTPGADVPLPPLPVPWSTEIFLRSCLISPWNGVGGGEEGRRWAGRGRRDETRGGGEGEGARREERWWGGGGNNICCGETFNFWRPTARTSSLMTLCSAVKQRSSVAFRAVCIRSIFWASGA